MIVTLLSETCSFESDVVTISDFPEAMVGILVPEGSDRRLSREKARGQKCSWRRESVGWPELVKAASEGEKMVADRGSEVRVG